MKIIRRIFLVVTLIFGIIALSGCIETSPSGELVTIKIISDNEIINTLIKNKGDKITSTNFFTPKEGYEFAGMYEDSEFINEIELPYLVNGDLSIYLKWEIKKYSVTWKDSDGTILKTDSNVNHGTIAQYDGVTPTKQGHTFTGWTPEFNEIKQDMIYTATYRKNDEDVESFVVKFFDGTTLLSEESLDEGAEVVFTVPTKAGNTFKGWLHNNKLVTTKVIVTSNLEFVASWELIVDGAIAKLDAAYNGLSTVISNPTNITEDFNVPIKNNGVTLSWVASGVNVVSFQVLNANSSKAVVNRPKAGDGDATITLTVKLTIASELDSTKNLTKTKTIEITVKQLELDGAIAKLDAAYNSLSTVISNPTNITEDFNVPIKNNGVTLSWVASGVNVVSFQVLNVNSSKAVVNRPKAGDGDATVTLTVKLTIASELDPTKNLTKTKTIEITVKQLEEENPTIENIADILSLDNEKYHNTLTVTIQNATVLAKGSDAVFIYDGSGTITLLNAFGSVEENRVYTVSGLIGWYDGNWIITNQTATLKSGLSPQYPEKHVINSISDIIGEFEANGYNQYDQVSSGNFEPIYAQITGKVYLITNDSSNYNTFIIDEQSDSLVKGTANKPASGIMVNYNTLNFQYIRDLVGATVTIDVIINTYDHTNNAFVLYYVGTPINNSDYEMLFEGDWNRPGLYNKDGSAHQMPNEIVKTGQTINVNNYNAKANDETFDNYQAFKNAIAAAKAGDEVFVPEGTYYFKSRDTSVSAYYTHIALKDGIIFSGAGIDKTILVSAFSQADNSGKQTTVIAVVNSKNIVIKDMSISSVTSDSDLPDPNNSEKNSLIYTAPKYGISIESDDKINTKEAQTSNVVIKNVLVEKFQRMGVRIKNAREVTVKSSVFQKAVDLAGGGAGYGVCIQGSDFNVDWTDTPLDTYWNLVTDNSFIGPYLRHGALIQYHAHNNAVLDNRFEGTLLDAIDMHGEDEYSNEIAYNEIINTRAGAAVGVGNSGATHDAAGRNNYIHHNIIDGGRRGIDVILGTPQTVIKDNVIKNLTQDNSIGITLSDAPHTYVIGNTFENIKSTKEGYGIKVLYYPNQENPIMGIPTDLTIINNSFNGVSKGVYVQAHDNNYQYENNRFADSVEYDYLDEMDIFHYPVVGFAIGAIESNFITTANETGSSTLLKLRSSSNGSNNRMIYVKFDITEKPVSYQRVYLAFTTKAQGNPTLNFWGTTTFTNWTTQTINWSTAQLHHPTIAKVDITGSHSATAIANFKMLSKAYEFNTYYIDVTDYITNVLDKNVFTIIISNDAMEGIYTEVQNHIAKDNQNLRLIFT